MAPFTGWLIYVMSWRWVFILEGIPPSMWVAVWWCLIADHPQKARWISPEEQGFLEKCMAAENATKKPASTGYHAAFTDHNVLWLTAAYFFWMAGFYGFTMWVPSVVKSFAVNDTASLVGWLSAIPFIFATISMVVNSVWSDRRMKRQAHIAGPLIIGMVGLIGGQFIGGSPFFQMIFLIIAAIGVYGPFGPFWAIPSTLLTAEVAGASIGLINAIGNLGGFIGPYVVEFIGDQSHSSFAGFLVLALFLFLTAGLVFFMEIDKQYI